MLYRLIFTALIFSFAGVVSSTPGDIAGAGDTGSKPSAGAVRQGEALYKASCVVCHGPRAAGGIGPRLAGNPVLSDDQAFWKIVYEGRHVMPPLKGAVSDQQMGDIRAWLKTLP